MTEKQQTHFVAIVKVVDHYYNYGDDYGVIAQSISDWEEIDVETFQLLKNASTFQTTPGSRYIVLERLTVDNPVVIDTVSAYVKLLAKQKADQEAEAAEREAKADKRRLNKLARDEKARLALYEQLQREFGKKGQNESR